ncbi:BirA family biotin operon repressor/biotin-[acetyl-CoA-carboxylase] ligase [Winogradskyella epiphytica]|uniref:BirA family biotin operon repressor/biotin-[acetyl-CoA-carboxylase] ligase n=1 Tax=Winogradskyella epiphytica TaxID=262005 RepID=A0A2V4XD29_9FLAO|nr:biotin--[acetyl-CoA-carboxylase] ligase [Winogradskyella epiphytica]PYE80445.1 BirA family biotin operon repressor/biotin-[acetyl-CoA-carboxylase] ligase [Winogradskyella epiphytica]GGW69410.1 biotin--[acetyl-CoA-carboxylase] ligase [Winogradskyella epiphytica]
MYIIKLDAIDSTNSYLKDLASVTLPRDYSVVVAEVQTKGRGQMGSVWDSESGKNLTASVFKRLPNFIITNQFYISMAVSLAIFKTLNHYNLPQIRIKWPNDILSADKKICGILIENIIKSNKIQGCIIGLGLNVNQKTFENLPQASSMSLLTGVIFDKDEILSAILEQLKFYFNSIETENYAEIKREYEAVLFRKNKPSTFRTSKNDSFSGIIQGVTETGELKVWTEDGIIKTFDLKEITLLY